MGPVKDRLPALWEWLEETRFLWFFFFLASLTVVLATAGDLGAPGRGMIVREQIVFWTLVAISGFLLIAALIGLLSYFIFLPSLSRDSHIFLRAHASHLIHPLKTALVLALAALCVVIGGPAGWAAWAALAAFHLLQTLLLIRRARREEPVGDGDGPGEGNLLPLLNLVLGTEIVSAASGVKGLFPWHLNRMPENTWIIDVRTKAEFQWNRLRGAENYPWGKGVIEAAQKKPADVPVLVICLSGHRSPSVAVTLRKLGFMSVYNLTWGLLYLILLGGDGRNGGPFSFARAQESPSRGNKDLKGISIAYGTAGALMLVMAPLEEVLGQGQVPGFQRACGALVGLGGLALATLSYRALGKNFRVYAAPRRNGKLVTSGVYSKVRHPMYTGAVLMMGGWVLFFGSLWSAPLWLAFSILYFIKSVKEERILADHFPEYTEYRKRTWKFLPYIY